MKPSDATKCCGTCRWADTSVIQLLDSGHYHEMTRLPCLFKPEIRASAAQRVEIRQRYLAPDKGTDCPCYERLTPDGHKETQ